MSEIDYGIAIIMHIALIGGLGLGIWLFSEPERKRLWNWFVNIWALAEKGE